MNITDILIPIISTLCLLSFFAYIRNFYIGHWSIYALNNTHNTFSLLRKILLILAGIGLFLCLYAGISLMLFWVPGGFIDDGLYQSYRDYISIILAFFIWCIIFATLINLTKDQENGTYYLIIAKGYKKILAARSNKQRLQDLILENEKEIKKLECELTRNPDSNKTHWALSAHKDLIKEIDTIIIKN